jgi:uncharacterized protein (DUF2252 family)
MERAVVFSVGLGLGIGSVPWNTSNARRSKVPWLPAAHVPVVQSNGLMHPAWYRAMVELFEHRMGGVQGQSVAQVATTVTQTQQQVVAATNKVVETIAYARSVDARASALKQVASDNGLSGTDSVPPPSNPPGGTVEP